MDNQVYKCGDQITLPSATGYLSGQIVLEGELGGIAVNDAADSKVVVARKGAYEVDGADGSYTVGQEVEASAAQGEVQDLSSGKLFGWVIEAVTVSGNDNKVKVLLAQ